MIVFWIFEMILCIEGLLNSEEIVKTIIRKSFEVPWEDAKRRSIEEQYSKQICSSKPLSIYSINLAL
jgi:hypothetical protein